MAEKNIKGAPEPKSITRDVDALRKNLDVDSKYQSAVHRLTPVIILLFILAAGSLFFRQKGAAGSILIFSDGVSSESLEPAQGWIGDAMEQALDAYLDVGEQIQIINQAAAAELTTKLGAQWIVSGTISSATETTDAIVLELELQSIDMPGRLFQAQLTGVPAGLNDLSARASAQVLAWLEQQPLSTVQLAEAEAELPVPGPAQIAFAEGTRALSHFEARLAVEKFEAALVAGGDHPVVHSRLAQAWTQLGYSGKARQAAARAFEMRSDLSRESQLEIEGQFRLTQAEWARAAEVFNALKEFHPNDMSYRLQLAEAQLNSSDLDEVSQNITDMRALPAPYREDPRIDLVESSYWHQKGNYEESSAIADKAVVKARDSEDLAILALALIAAVNSESSNKTEYLAEAESLFPILNNPRYQSAVLSEIAKQERYDGRIDPAKEYYRQALAVAQSIGDEPQVADAKNGLSIALDLEGQLSNGLALKQEVMNYYAVRGIKARHSIMLENIGISLFKMGRLSEAEQSFDEALEIFSVVDDSIGIAWAPYHRSRLRSRAGDLINAAQLADEAVANSVDNPEGSLELNAQFEVAQILFHQGRIDEAKTMFTALEQSFEEIENSISTGESAHMLARIALRRGEYSIAREKLEKAAKIYADSDTGYYALDALITRADLAFVNFDNDFESACGALAPLARKVEHALIGLRAQLRLTRCLTPISAQSTSEAIAATRLVEDRARDLGLFEPLLEASMIRTQIFESSGQVAEASKERERLLSLAASKGWSMDWTL